MKIYRYFFLFAAFCAAGMEKNEPLTLFHSACNTYVFSQNELVDRDQVLEKLESLPDADVAKKFMGCMRKEYTTYEFGVQLKMAHWLHTVQNGEQLSRGIELFGAPGAIVTPDAHSQRGARQIDYQYGLYAYWLENLKYRNLYSLFEKPLPCFSGFNPKQELEYISLALCVAALHSRYGALKPLLSRYEEVADKLVAMNNDTVFINRFRRLMSAKISELHGYAFLPGQSKRAISGFSDMYFFQFFRDDKSKYHGALMDTLRKLEGRRPDQRFGDVVRRAKNLMNRENRKPRARKTGMPRKSKRQEIKQCRSDIKVIDDLKSGKQEKLDALLGFVARGQKMLSPMLNDYLIEHDMMLSSEQNGEA